MWTARVAAIVVSEERPCAARGGLLRVLWARAGASSTKRSPESSTARCAAHQAAMEAALACFFSASWGCRRVFARLSGAARASQGRFVLVAWRGAVLQADSTVNHGV